MTKTVFVTGASGYIASHIVEQLLTTTTHTVRGSVRNLKDAAKTAHLTSLPHAAERLQLVEADLTTDGAFNQAFQGCDAVIHTASPYVLNVKDPQRDLVDPAEQGTLNVLRAVVSSGTVRTVVITSSMVAMTDEPVPGHAFTEADWNTKSNLKRNAYSYSKVRAEKAAWEFVELPENKDKFRLVFIHPFAVIGPSHTKTVNVSVEIIQEIVTGKMPGIVDLNFGYVDVRDVARAHIRAVEVETAQGRYVCAAEAWHLEKVIEVLKREFPGYCYPSFRLPNALVCVASYFEGQGRGSFLRSHIGKGGYEFDNAKIKKDLGMEFMSVETSVMDTLKDLRKWGNVPEEK
ncbi:NAD-dependent epimerase/dehydratase [Jimgerdemannia flammicorona]|uniref:NAD-dependent epimerase/dehydratase n=2 Tax=Jimgerdemannia flammicorona TaxID=994334 RepID=A0A433D4F7_9FUNG|nr:NAD-dependent epimerase/dehydratase [Jimgerdemannia flammicorona]RUS25290.1 NAD-dependent epimerase/dehydratase [Jimgerdemannia flammicorona]